MDIHEILKAAGPVDIGNVPKEQGTPFRVLPCTPIYSHTCPHPNQKTQSIHFCTSPQAYDVSCRSSCLFLESEGMRERPSQSSILLVLSATCHCDSQPILSCGFALHLWFPPSCHGTGSRISRSPRPIRWLMKTCRGTLVSTALGPSWTLCVR